jgi:hypothetical protein
MEEQLMAPYDSYEARFCAFRDRLKETSEGAYADLQRLLLVICNRMLSISIT